MAKGLLTRNGEKYPTLAVTQAGRTFLKKREKLFLAKPRQIGDIAPTKSAVDLDFDQELFEQLRTQRKRIADTRCVPP